MERLVTWLWQGTVLAVGMWGLLRVWRPNAATRYALWWTMLLAMLMLLVAPLPSRVTASVAGTPGSASLATRAAVAAVAIEEAASPVSLLPFTLPAVPRALIAVGIGVWLGLAVLGLVRLGLCVSHLRRIKRACRPLPFSRECRLRQWMAVRDEGRAARLCLSDDVRSASALGLAGGAAIIAINPSLLVDVDDEELDHIVLHEYAHIQRRDDWLQVLQIALQAVLLVHPVVSWIGRMLRLEREAACDDWVVDRTRMTTTYAQCLTKVAAFELAGPDDHVAAVGAAGRRGDLTRRIERLLEPRRITPARMSAVLVASAAAAMTAAIVGLWQLPPLVAMPGTTASGVLEEVSAAVIAAPDAGTAPALDAIEMAAAVIIERERAGLTAMRRVTPARLVAVAATLTSPAPAPAPVSEIAPAETQPIASRSVGMTAHLMTTPLTPLTGTAVDLGINADRHAESSDRNNAAETDEDGANGANGADGAPGSSRRVWKRAADLGVAAGQSAPNVGQNVGQATASLASSTLGAGASVGQRAKRAGTATGGFFSRVASSISRALP